jgi:hypothetical protein
MILKHHNSQNKQNGKNLQNIFTLFLRKVGLLVSSHMYSYRLYFVDIPAHQIRSNIISFRPLLNILNSKDTEMGIFYIVYADEHTANQSKYFIYQQ